MHAPVPRRGELLKELTDRLILGTACVDRER